MMMTQKSDATVQIQPLAHSLKKRKVKVSSLYPVDQISDFVIVIRDMLNLPSLVQSHCYLTS